MTHEQLRHENLQKPSIVNALRGFGEELDNPRPERCRGLIFNNEGTDILGIKRIRPGRDPYVVFPGGGLEDEDLSAIDGIYRELSEELGIQPTELSLEEWAIEQDGQLYFVGIMINQREITTIGGPEASRDEQSGAYLPGWYKVKDLLEENAVPSEIVNMIIAADENSGISGQGQP